MTQNAHDGENRELGIQPLDALLQELRLENRDLVSASTEQLTHKQVQKARKGRRVTSNIQGKIRNAIEQAVAGRGEERRFALEELFNYRG